MKNNSIIKTLKPSTLIYDKNHNSYLRFYETTHYIISQGFYYMEPVKYISENIGNKKITIRATHENTKIVCVGFLSYFILNTFDTTKSLSSIARDYYSTRPIEYSKDIMDVDNAEAKYISIHLSEENEFFEYAKKNFFPLLPNCDVDDLTSIYNQYVHFINSINNHIENNIFDTNLLSKYNEFATSIQSYIETRIDGTLIKHIIEHHDLPIGTSPLKFKEKNKFINIWYFIEIFQIPTKNMKKITNEDLKHNQKSNSYYNDFGKICATFKKSIDLTIDNISPSLK